MELNRVLVIGTPVCPKCKQLAPKIEEYCKEHNIEYEYKHLGDAPFDVIELLKSNNITSAPVAIHYEDEETTIYTGDLEVFFRKF